MRQEDLVGLIDLLLDLRLLPESGDLDGRSIGGSEGTVGQEGGEKAER